jgi:hypothetical protein
MNTDGHGWKRIVVPVVIAFFLASTLNLRPCSAQVIEGDPPTTTSGDDGGSSDNTLSFVLLGAVIAVVIGVGIAYSRDDDVVRYEQDDDSPLKLVMRDAGATDGLDLLAGLAFNGEF